MSDAIPFVAAILMCLAGPLLTRRVIRTVVSWVEQSQRAAGIADATIPVHLQIGFLKRYLEYAAELVQIVPTVLLTTVSAVVLLPTDYSPGWTATILLLAVLVIVVIDAVVSGMPPERFLRMKVRGVEISLISGVAIALNLGGLVFYCVAEAVKK